jgi:hypothetical protein
LGALSLYFQSQVSGRTDLAESYTEQDGAASQSVRLEQQTVVQTETELFAVRYTDPWRNGGGLWEMAAYIDRAEAWALFEPRLASKTAPFMVIAEAAKKDPEPMRRFFRYLRARSLDPSLYLDFARSLHPERAAAFNPVREAAAALPQRLDEAKFEASLYIESPVDMDGVIVAALTRALSAEGFPVTKNRNAASAVCRALVDEGMEKREGGIFYTPKLTIAIQGKTDPLFSMTIAAPRQSATNSDIARRRAYSALTGEIEAQFHNEFEKQMSAINN